MAVEVFMPKMSDHMESGEVICWLVAEGDRVEAGQPILELQTDKAVVELKAPAAGILKGIRKGAEKESVVPVGEPLAFIAGEAEEVPALAPLEPFAESAADEKAAAPPAADSAPSPAPETGSKPGRVRATPVARRVARELRVDLTQVTGTGVGDRISEEDVRAFAATQGAAAPAPGAEIPLSPAVRQMVRELNLDPSRVVGSGRGGRVTKEDVLAFVEGEEATSTPPAEEGTWIDLTSIQRLTGRRMVESVQTAPQFSLAVEADMTRALQLRQTLMERVEAKTGTRLSITAILVKVAAAALARHPRVNASWAEGRVRLHPHVNVGVAFGTDRGLAVPVIREADQKPVGRVAQELKGFQAKAREMRFGTEDLSESTFTLSNLGMYGVDRFRAIVNPPESAILAVGRIVKRPVGLPDDTVGLLPMMNLTLSVDHRVLDGVQGALFLSEVRTLLEEPYLLL